MPLDAYWYSLRYQQPRQILGRLRYWLGWQFYPHFPAIVRAWCGPAARSCRPPAAFSWPGEPARGRGCLGDNRFCFLNEPVDFGDRINWNPPGKSVLWRFHLHYFDWAPGCDLALLARHISSWIEQNPPGSWPGWHPYPTSLRIVNWIRSGVASSRVAESLALQAAFLERNLEFHLGGNHLLENARALLAAGLFFEGSAAETWRAGALHLLRRQLEAQVLPDGGHVERSPFYHARMTRLVRDCIDLLAGQGCEIPPELSRATEKMTAFHQALRHQDGGLPLFHDALDSDDLSPPSAGGPLSFPASGYYILETPQGRLIADYGAPGACYNPGHQHAGIFSFEISSGARRVIVDSGTPTYERGPQRDRLRSTAAHNTVRVDGQDQFQVWDSFRAGRRAWVGAVDECREPQFQAVSASHNGYARLGVEHHRTIVCLPAGWLIVDDLAGRGPHRLESFLHLAPGIIPEIHEGRVCLLRLGWVVLPFGLVAPPEITPGQYSPALGVVEPSQTLVLRAGPSLPCRCGYFLGPAAAARLAWDGVSRITIETPHKNFSVHISLTDGIAVEVS